MNVTFARFCSRDDRFFQDGEAQGEGHRDPFAGLHAHGTTLRLESAQLCGNLVVTLREVWKREVARGAGVRRADGDTPNRHVNAWQRGTGLVDDGTDHRSPRAVRPWKRATQKSIRAAASNFMVRREMYILAQRRHLVGPILCFVCKTGAGRRFPRVVLTGLLLLGAAANGAAQPVQKQVLVLQSVDRGNIVVDHFTTNFHVELDQRAEQPVNFVQVVVGPIGSVGAPERAIVDFIVSTFADGPKPDLIVAVSGPASIFARKYRQQLFPDTPLLFAAVDERYLRAAPLGENETAVAVANDFPRLIDDILQVLPQTRQVFVVAGTGQLGQFWRRELEEPFSRFRDRLTFEWLDNLSLSEMLRRCASLPDNSAIFYLTFGTDAAGAAYADERVLADLHATANAPVFGGQSVYLGAGVVGGTMLSVDTLARNTADVAIRLLNGAPPGSINVPPQRPGQPIFDWRELQRWGIPESRLPPGSVVRYRAPSLWQRIQGHGAERRRRAGRPIAPDRRAPVSAPRTPAGRDREPEEPGARRRRQSPPDDVGADQLDWT